MRPRHDPLPGMKPLPGLSAEALRRAVAVAIGRKRRGRRDRDPGGEPCPVEPNRPLDLSGGAGAALEID